MTTTTCSVPRMTVALNLPDGASPPAAAFRALAGVRDAMANGTYGYGGDDNGDVVVGGGGRVHPAVWIATTYLGPDPDPAMRGGGGGVAGGGEGDAGVEASPDGGGDGSSLSASAAAGGGAALLATGGSLLVLSFVLRWGGRSGGECSRVTVGGRGGGLVSSSPRGPLSRRATGGRGLGLDPLRGYPGRLSPPRSL